MRRFFATVYPLKIVLFIFSIAIIVGVGQQAFAQSPLDNSVTIGEIEMYAGSAAPNGYLICDGSAINRSTYAALFAVIGTTYGAGNGSTTFNLPNLADRFPLGKSAVYPLATPGGEISHTLAISEMPSHTHGRYWQFIGSNGTTRWINSTTAGTTFETLPTGGGLPHNNMPPYLAVNFVIAYTNVLTITANPTPTPYPTNTPAPTNTPHWTPTAYPTNTPHWTPTAYPTNTPHWTPTAYPTNTPAPTGTPVTITPVVVTNTHYITDVISSTISLSAVVSSYTRTLSSGNMITFPVQMSSGEIIFSSVMIIGLTLMSLGLLFKDK